MTSRIFQPGDAIEWTVNVGKGDRIVRGVVESIGRDKNEGLAMVREIGQPTSRPIRIERLRDRKTHATTPAIGGDVA